MTNSSIDKVPAMSNSINISIYIKQNHNVRLELKSMVLFNDIQMLNLIYNQNYHVA